VAARAFGLVLLATAGGCRLLLGVEDPIIDSVAHLDSDVESMLGSTATLVIAQPTSIDTTTGTVTPALPSDVIVLASVPQHEGPFVMVIQARRIEIRSALIAVGDRPLILVATEALVVDAAIDVSASGATAGAGGLRQGPGVGRDGQRGTNVADSGGSGGSYGTLGGVGGVSGGVAGGLTGATYAEADSLQGGSVGGRGTTPACGQPGGAGGGAIQLTAASITIMASIDAGGGGGRRGDSCMGDGTSGAGGGSGGMIFLQSPDLAGSGMLVANGGGGGGGASASGASGADGEDGSIARGGYGGAGSGLDNGGGRGASAGFEAVSGGSATQADDNGGGGGGGAGCIFFQTTGPPPSYVVSPAPIAL
jgi:hypothetical protein